jgi:hypothetical protein
MRVFLQLLKAGYYGICSCTAFKVVAMNSLRLVTTASKAEQAGIMQIYAQI